MSSLSGDSKNAYHSPATKIHQGTSFTSIVVFHTHICHLLRRIFSRNSFTNNSIALFHIQHSPAQLCHTTLWHTFFLTQPFWNNGSSSILFVFPSFPILLQPLFLIIGRSWLVGLSGPFNFGIHMSRSAWIEACLHMMLHMLPSMHCCVTWWQGPSRASQQTNSHGSWGTHCFWKGKRTNIGRWEASGRICQLIEGSLEVKLPTIWTDEKQSKEEAERRERLEERRCRCAKR